MSYCGHTARRLNQQLAMEQAGAAQGQQDFRALFAQQQQGREGDMWALLDQVGLCHYVPEELRAQGTFMWPTTRLAVHGKTPSRRQPGQCRAGAHGEGGVEGVLMHACEPCTDCSVRLTQPWGRGPLAPWWHLLCPGSVLSCLTLRLQRPQSACCTWAQVYPPPHGPQATRIGACGQCWLLLAIP
jgi:hypothetical protein